MRPVQPSGLTRGSSCTSTPPSPNVQWNTTSTPTSTPASSTTELFTYTLSTNTCQIHQIMGFYRATRDCTHSFEPLVGRNERSKLRQIRCSKMERFHRTTSIAHCVLLNRRGRASSRRGGGLCTTTSATTTLSTARSKGTQHSVRYSRLAG